MIQEYSIKDGRIGAASYKEGEAPPQGQSIWIDLESPTKEEIRYIEERFGTTLPTRHEMAEIETSSRYWEDGGTLIINTAYLLESGNHYRSESVSFVLVDGKLITVRFTPLRSFEELARKLSDSSNTFKTGLQVLSGLFGLRIDIDADMIERLVKEISSMRRKILFEKSVSEETLNSLSRIEDTNMMVREGMMDKQRILSALLKNSRMDKRAVSEIKIMLKDVNSLIQHTEFNFDRIDYIQNISAAMVTIRQNKTMSIFTLVNVVFLPPTLIASIYGMNFEKMPELSWEYGYLFALGLIIASAIIPFLLFKRKGLL